MNRVKKLIHTDYAYKSGLSGRKTVVAVMPLSGVALLFAGGVAYTAGIVFYKSQRHYMHFVWHLFVLAGSILQYAGNGGQSRDRRGICVYSGIAPRAEIILLKVLDERGNGSTAKVLEGIDWLLRNHRKYHIRLLNISVGMLPDAGKKEQQELLAAVDEVWDHGILVVAAAGNNGPKENTVTIPGISRKILTVGSSDDESAEGGRLGRGYSGKGPTECCIIKPEILAPGTGIVSCSGTGRGYQVKSGTSMAAPVVTGALALAFERYPHLEPAEMKLRLYERAYPRGEQLGKKAWGIIHADNLVRGF